MDDPYGSKTHSYLVNTLVTILRIAATILTPDGNIDKTN